MSAQDVIAAALNECVVGEDRPSTKSENSMKRRPLLDPAVCPHLTLDGRTTPHTCGQCGTRWVDIDLIENRNRLAQHAAGEHCDGCGTNEYPHGDNEPELTLDLGRLA